VLLPPLAGQLVQRLGQVGQGNAVVVQEAVGAQDGGEAIGQSGGGESMDASGEGIAHTQMLQDKLAVAQLESRFQSWCEECIPSFEAPTCDKSIGPETVPQRGEKNGVGQTTIRDKQVSGYELDARFAFAHFADDKSTDTIFL
jgi:hypothetical protein